MHIRVAFEFHTKHFNEENKIPIDPDRVTQDHNNTARREVRSDKTHRTLQFSAILSSKKLKHSGTALMVGKW